MYADGPADGLDFDDLEFLGALSVSNRLMYRRRKTNNLLRAWILFQEHIINNDVVRHAVQNNGFEPWLLPNSAVECLWVRSYSYRIWTYSLAKFLSNVG